MTERVSSGARLEIENLSKDYATGGRTSRIVHGISFAIEPGHFYSLLGPSGCGKTTTLRCVAGLEHADGGTITLGRPTASSRRRATCRPDQRDIGMVFQNYAIWPHMTVFENVAFPLRVERPRLSKKADRERVEEALAAGAARRPRRTGTPSPCRAASSSASRSRGRWCASP